jgi:hypothetical protein
MKNLFEGARGYVSRGPNHSNIPTFAIQGCKLALVLLVWVVDSVTS